MPAIFRPFASVEEKNNASALIETIDKGEKWIFDGAQGSEDFGGYIDHLYYSENGVIGTYNACVYNGKLRIQIAFNTDLPDELGSHLLWLMEKARKRCNTFTSIWYKPENEKLDKFLFGKLPWEAKGHKTHELTAKRNDFINTVCVLPENFKIISFEEKYLECMCTMLDKSLANTFDDPEAGIFTVNKDYYLKDWSEKAKSGQCNIMLENENIAGAYILKGAEIDFVAVSTDKQGKGLGTHLLKHAIANIIANTNGDPYLYCIDKNAGALRFYLREGLVVTGHSGYIYLSESSADEK